MKKVQFILIAIIVVLFGAALFAATVTTRTETNRVQYSFSLEPGDRIIVVKKGARSVSVSSTASKTFDLKVPEKAILNGQLILSK